MAKKFKNVAVLMGGMSSERKVSLISGAAIMKGLSEADYNAEGITLESDSLKGVSLKNIDAVFIAMHGGYGEGGGVQADLDALGIPYTGSGAEASRLAMDKIATKRVLVKEKLPTPEFEVLELGQNMTSFELPCVVKPPRDGSSIGIFRILERKDWESSVRRARHCDDRGEVLVERYIDGREWTVSIIDDLVLPVEEVVAPDAWYGYQAKYTAGMSQYVFPKESELTKKAQKLALQTYKALGCRGCARVDFRLDANDGLYILEVNTVPGFTPTSLLPKAAAAAGIDFVQLCARLMELAACDRVIA